MSHDVEATLNTFDFRFEPSSNELPVEYCNHLAIN
jgi:hypothetical protein